MRVTIRHNIYLKYFMKTVWLISAGFLWTNILFATNNHSIRTGSFVPSSAFSDFSGYSVLALNSMLLSNNVFISSGHIGVNQAGVGPFLYDGMELYFSNGTSTAPDLNVKANTIGLSRRAVIQGDAYYNILNNQGTINGELFTPLQLPLFNQLPSLPEIIPGTTSVTVPNNRTVYLDEGNYSNIVINNRGKLILTGGVYSFRSLTVGNQVELLCQDVTEVNIQERISTGQNVVIGPHASSNINASDIIMYVQGQNGETGALSESPKAVQFGANNVVNSILFIPNGTLDVQRNAAIEGLFIAKDVLLENNVRVTATEIQTIPNQPPVVNLGPDLLVEEGDTVVFYDVATDDGLPETGSLTFQWEQISGEGTAWFSDPAGSSTYVSFSAIGDYTLRCTASDGELSAEDDVVCIVNEAVHADPSDTTATVVAEPQGIEVKGKRGLQSKTYYNPADNVMAMTISSNFIHYADEYGNMHPIDTNIGFNEDSTHYEVTRGVYLSEFALNHSADFPVQAGLRDSSKVETKLASLGLFTTDGNQYMPFSSSGSSAGVVDTSAISYANVMSGVDLTCIYQPDALMELITLNQTVRDNMPDPQGYGFSTENTYLALATEIKISGGLQPFAGEVPLNCLTDGEFMNGDLNLNPASDFDMQTPFGPINIDSLQAWGNDFTYEGKASEISLTAATSGNAVMINGTAVALQTDIRFTFQSSAMEVSLRNQSGSGDWETGKTEWWIEIRGIGVDMTPALALPENSGAFDEPVTLRDLKGDVQFVLEKDYAFLTDDPNSTVHMLQYVYEENEKHYLLSGIPLAWLNAQPAGGITIDPTLGCICGFKDTYISSANQTAIHDNDSKLRVSNDPSDRCYTLLKFDLSAIPENATVIRAYLNVYQVGEGPNKVQCHEILKSWNPREATWQNRTATEEWAAYGLSFSGSDPDVKSLPEDVSNDASQRLSILYGEMFNIKALVLYGDIFNITSLTQRWIQDEASNHGLLLYAPRSSAGDTERNYYASHYRNDILYCYTAPFSDGKPYLHIEFKVGPLVEYTYDNYGRLGSATYANGVKEDITYNDARDWVTKKEYKEGNNLNVFSFACDAYDKTGNLKEVSYKHGSQAVKTQSFTYDDLHRLKTFRQGTVSRSYAYDDNGNLTSFAGRSFQYRNNNNQLTNDSRRSFTYDAIGRATDIYDTQDQMSCVMDYDMFNNMTRSYLSNQYISEYYTYDSNGMRVYKLARFLPLSSTISSESKYYLNDDANVLAEYDLSGNLNAEYIYGLRGMIAKVEPDEGYYFYYKDHLGSTRQLSRNAQTNDYFPYGESMEESGTETQYRFSGKELDNYTGFYDFGRRSLLSAIGRWMVPDPLAEKYPTLSPYVYCVNNPINVIDPTGMDTTAIFFDQRNQPRDDYQTAQYTAEVFVDVDGKVYGPYEGSTFPDSKENEDITIYNTLDEGKHEINNATGHRGGTKKGLNIVKDKDITTQVNREGLPGKDPNGNQVRMINVNVHSGYNTRRFSEGCPTIKPSDFSSFTSHYDWSGANSNTGNSKGYLQIYRGNGIKATIHKTYLQIKQKFQN